MRGRAGLLFVCLVLVTACSVEPTVTTSDDPVVLPTTMVTTGAAAASTTAPASTAAPNKTTTTTTQPEAVPLPWVFSGLGTLSYQVTAPTYLEWSFDFDVTFTVFEDGRLEAAALLPAGHPGLSVDCTKGTIGVSTNFPEEAPPVFTLDTHEDGTISGGTREVRVGTVDQESLRYEGVFASTYETCIGSVTSESVYQAYLPRTAP